MELIITLSVLTILTLGVIPLIKTSVKRQREQELREALREMRNAVEDFHRDALGGPCAPAAGPGMGQGVGAGPGQSPFVGVAGQNPPGANPAMGPQGMVMIDPRSRVAISDCTIFSVDNIDRYPPKLETLVEGVSVVPRGGPPVPTNPLQGNATDSKLLALKKKVYLRRIPVDPMTGKAEWDLRSNFDPADSSSWGGENVFDVRSKSTAAALNGEKYNEW